MLAYALPLESVRTVEARTNSHAQNAGESLRHINYPDNSTKAKIKTLIQIASIKAMALNDRIFSYDHPWVDEIRWWIEGQLSSAFGFAYDDSNEEIESVFNGEIPPCQMTPRQFAVIADDLDWHTASCCKPSCLWTGKLTQGTSDFRCPNCNGTLNIEPFYYLPA